MNKTIYSLQYLRAIAASSVVYFHISGYKDYSHWIVFGSFGVDIFFVLSGFVIAMITQKNTSPINFAISRISRIVPSYWLLTIALFLLALIKPELLSSTRANLDELIKSLLFVPYYDSKNQIEPLLSVGWTLNYEMYFYACAMLGLVLFKRFGVIFSIIPITAFYIISYNSYHNEAIFKFVSSWRVFEFVSGMILFKITKTPIELSPLKTILLILIAIFCYIGLAFQELNCDGLLSAILSITLSSLMVAIFIRLEPIFTKIPEKVSKFFISIGDASYATYLTHFFTMNLFIKIICNKLMHISGESVLLVSLNLIACLIIGHLFYIFLDNPMHLSMRRFISSKIDSEYKAK